MQVVIPMSGFGERFRRAGYRLPKPLIEVEGKPVVAHVVDMFPGAKDFIFVCNAEHLAEAGLAMRETLERYCPTGRIVPIAPHWLGPVHAVREAYGAIDPARPVIVNYCDFTCYWDYADFCRFVAETGCAGAIPVYRGFHPHSLGSTRYAYLREKEGWLLDIQEKKSFSDQPMEEFASSGTYYFESGELMRESFDAAIAQGLRTGDEYYVSLAFKPLLAAGHSVAVYELQHFMQWGTPEDFEEYRRWSDVFRQLASESRDTIDAHGNILVPMAGLGERFRKAGYETPKPLIEVSGRPMFVQAIADMPAGSRTRVVVRRDLPGLETIDRELRNAIPGADLRVLPGPTDGQARTCVLGLEGMDSGQALTIIACDNGALYDRAEFRRLAEDDDWDVLVWSVRGYPPARQRPEHFGWIAADKGGAITGVSVKKPLANPARDPVTIGAFTFRRTSDFLAAAERLFARDGRVNGEFYADSCIEDALALGLRCRLFEVDHYLCWGTPDELRTFEYWQSCFHKWPSHPYRLERDRRVDPRAISRLETRYRKLVPVRPAPRGRLQSP
jgi:NDP-sugar pyrophosphorylase family protein